MKNKKVFLLILLSVAFTSGVVYNTYSDSKAVADTDYLKQAERTTLDRCKGLRSAIQVYLGDHGQWPASLDAEGFANLYIEVIPSEMISPSNKVIDQLDGSGGWYFSAEYEEFGLNLRGKDSQGKNYEDY